MSAAGLAQHALGGIDNLRKRDLFEQVVQLPMHTMHRIGYRATGHQFAGTFPLTDLVSHTLDKAGWSLNHLHQLRQRDVAGSTRETIPSVRPAHRLDVSR